VIVTGDHVIASTETTLVQYRLVDGELILLSEISMVSEEVEPTG